MDARQDLPTDEPESFSADEAFDTFLSAVVVRASKPEQALRDISTAGISPLVAEIVCKATSEHATAGRMQHRECAKMACLLYLAAVAFDCQHSQITIDEYMASLSGEVQRRANLHSVCAEELLYVLFQGFGEGDDEAMQRVWLVSRFMEAAKGLSGQRWNRAHQVLIRFLDLSRS